MLRAQVLKAARVRAKAAAKAAKAAAEAAARNPDVIVTSSNSNDTCAAAKPDVDRLTFAHQRAIAAVATLIQVNAFENGNLCNVTANIVIINIMIISLLLGCSLYSVAHHPSSTPTKKHISPEYKDHSRVR